MAQSGLHLNNSAQTIAFFRPLLKPCQFEHCIAVHLDADLHVAKTTQMTSSAVGHAQVSVRTLVEDALACDATAIVLVHNHPSGIAEPSQSDCDMTQVVVQTLQPLGIRLIDHVIIAGARWTSFRELGLL